MRDSMARNVVQEAGGWLRWLVADSLGSELGLSKQARSLSVVCDLHSLFCWAPCLPLGDTGGKTLPPGKLPPCQAWKSLLCQPASCWPQISFFSPNAFSLLPESDRGWRGFHVMPALASSAPKRPHAFRLVHTHVHAHSSRTVMHTLHCHQVPRRVPGLGCEESWDLSVTTMTWLCRPVSGSGSLAGQVQAHLKQPPPTLNPNTAAALLEPGLFS